MNLSSLGRHRQAPRSGLPDPGAHSAHSIITSLLPYFFLLFAFFCLFSTTTCAAASREIGTRNGEALT